jgi:hypothetical protein
MHSTEAQKIVEAVRQAIAGKESDIAEIATATVLRELAAKEVREFAEDENMLARDLAIYAYYFPTDPLVKRFLRLHRVADEIETVLAHATPEEK